MKQVASHHKGSKNYQPGDYSSIYERIQEEIDVEDITKEIVRKKINATPSFPKRQRLAEEFFIARSISIGQKYADKLGIILDNKTTARVEKWKRKEVIVIRRDGKFLKWKLI